MATRKPSLGRHSAHSSCHSDAIRIVPVPPPQALQASAPQLTYRNGPLLSAVEVFTVFWGTPWNSAPQLTLMNDMNGFFDSILTSALIDQLAEYNAGSYRISHGKRTGTTVITPALASSVNDTTIQTELQNAIASNRAFPQPGANTLYFVFMPEGVKVVQGGSASCQAFCG